jgi:hypothetical protein
MASPDPEMRGTYVGSMEEEPNEPPTRDTARTRHPEAEAALFYIRASRDPGRTMHHRVQVIKVTLLKSNQRYT